MKPLVTVLINNYNYSKYIKECINSVLYQTYENIEIIVFDDNSTDNSLEVINSFKDKIKLVINNKKKSKYNSHNQFNAISEALKLSKGEIVFLLDSDDFFAKDKIKKIVKIYAQYPEILSVQDSIINVDANSKKNKKKLLFLYLEGV